MSARQRFPYSNRFTKELNNPLVLSSAKNIVQLLATLAYNYMYIQSILHSRKYSRFSPAQQCCTTSLNLLYAKEFNLKTINQCATAAGVCVCVCICTVQHAVICILFSCFASMPSAVSLSLYVVRTNEV